MNPNQDEIDALVDAYKILVNENVLDGFGHLSIRSAADPTRFLMPRAMPPALVEPDDLVELEVATSQPIDPRGRRVNGERYLHGEIYKARPDARAIVHSHSPSVIPLTIARAPMRPVVVQAGFMPLEVPTFELRDMRGDGRGLQITDTARGAALARTLGAAPVALLRGHGNVVVGASVKQATIFAIYTEINARVQLQAMALGGGPVVSLDEPETFGPSEFDINRPWEHYRHRWIGAPRGRVDRAQFGLDQTQRPA